MPVAIVTVMAMVPIMAMVLVVLVPGMPRRAVASPMPTGTMPDVVRLRATAQSPQGHHEPGTKHEQSCAFHIDSLIQKHPSPVLSDTVV